MDIAQRSCSRDSNRGAFFTAAMISLSAAAREPIVGPAIIVVGLTVLGTGGTNWGMFLA